MKEVAARKVWTVAALASYPASMLSSPQVETLATVSPRQAASSSTCALLEEVAVSHSALLEAFASPHCFESTLFRYRQSACTYLMASEFVSLSSQPHLYPISFGVTVGSGLWLSLQGFYLD